MKTHQLYLAVFLQHPKQEFLSTRANAYFNIPAAQILLYTLQTKVSVTYLLHAVKKLLAHPRSLLDPRLLRPPGEELRSLQYSDRGVRQVRDRLGQEVSPGTKVSVENHEGLASRHRKSMPEVPRLSRCRAISPPYVCGEQGEGRGACEHHQITCIVLQSGCRGRSRKTNNVPREGYPRWARRGCSVTPREQTVF